MRWPSDNNIYLQRLDGHCAILFSHHFRTEQVPSGKYRLDSWISCLFLVRQVVHPITFHPYRKAVAPIYCPRIAATIRLLVYAEWRPLNDLEALIIDSTDIHRRRHPPGDVFYIKIIWDRGLQSGLVIVAYGGWPDSIMSPSDLSATAEQRRNFSSKYKVGLMANYHHPQCHSIPE